MKSRFLSLPLLRYQSIQRFGHLYRGMSSSEPKIDISVNTMMRARPQHKFIVKDNSTILEAIIHLNENNLLSSLVSTQERKILGLFTAKDVLRYLQKNYESEQTHNYRINPNNPLLKNVKEIMTVKDKLIYCSGSDSLSRARDMMQQLRVSNLPVVENNEIIGIITERDVIDPVSSLHDPAGGKKSYFNIMGRKGIPSNVNVGTSTSGRLSGQPILDCDIGVAALPHPFKTPDGCAHSFRSYGPLPLCEDTALSEDAYFTIRVPYYEYRSRTSSESKDKVYVGIADGVGSWRQEGEGADFIDPRKYSNRLLVNARSIVEHDVKVKYENSLMAGSNEEDDQEQFDEVMNPLHPMDIINAAWDQNAADKIIGSCCVCVATLDHELNQLSYSNLGDCGLLIIRHLDSEIAGYMRERHVDRHLRNNDLRIAYMSQQQLLGFNYPFQLGYSGHLQYKGTFQNPSEADTASIPVMPGDIVILATDGLFDNVDIPDILNEVSKWEKKWYGQNVNTTAMAKAIQVPSDFGEKANTDLAQILVKKSRDYSIDEEKDSPFAILAKENDILWRGGMPDDTTVIVMRIYAKSDE